MGFLIDLINAQKIGLSLKKLFIIMGSATSILSAAMTFWFYMVSKERVSQSIERPSVAKGLKAIINNKPLLLITLSDFLSGFGISQSRSDYYIDVLGQASLQTLVGIPAYPILNISYSFVSPLRRKFTSKKLWIAEDIWTDMCWLIVFGIGSLNKNFMKRKVMIPVMMIEEFVEMWVYGVRHVIPTSSTTKPWTTANGKTATESKQ